MSNKATKGPKAKPIDLQSKGLTEEEITKLKEAFKAAFIGTDPVPVYSPQDAFTEIDLEELSKAIVDSEITTVEEANTMGKMVSKLLVAERTGQDPDFSDFQVAPIPEVVEAIDKQLAHDTPDDTLHARLSKIGRLFAPNAANVIPENFGYIHLTTPMADVAIYASGISTKDIFKKHQTHRNQIDTDSVEKAVRRLDAEIRNLDPLAREELNFVVMEKIIQTSAQGESRGYFFQHNINFDMLSDASKQTLSDLITFYNYVRTFNTLLTRTKEEVRRNVRSDGGVMLKSLLNRKSSNPTIPFHHQYGISGDDYKCVLILKTALTAALPNTFADSVKAALQVTKKLQYDLDLEFYNGDTLEASKQLRHAFIALVQNRGSYENFFSTTFKLHTLLQRELEERMLVVHALVYLYNSLGLNIVDVIEKSKERILFDLPF